MKRLYNQYLAADVMDKDVQEVNKIADAAAEMLVQLALKRKLDLRDVSAEAQACIHTRFCEEIIRYGLNKRRQEREVAGKK